MICDKISCKNWPYLVWIAMIAYYEDSSMFCANSILIAINMSKFCPSQFESWLKFLAKFQEEIIWYHNYSPFDITDVTCTSYLNMSLSEDKEITSELGCIECSDPNHKFCTKFFEILKLVQFAAAQLDGGKEVQCTTKFEAMAAKRNVYLAHTDFNMYSPDTNSDLDPPDPDDIQSSAYFSSIDIPNCNDVPILQAL